MSFNTGVLINGLLLALHIGVRSFPCEMVRKAPMLIVSRFSLQKKTREVIILLVATLSILLTPEIFAQGVKPAPAETSTTVAQINKSTPSGWSLDLGFEYSENVAQQEEGPKESGMELLLTPNYKINGTFSLGVKASIIQASTENKKPSLSNTQVILGMKGWALKDSMTTVHSAAAILPTSIVSREDDRLKSSISISNGLAWIATPRFIAIYKLGFSRNFHEFTINADGLANVEYRIAHSLDLKLMLTKKLYLTTIGVFRQGRTYQGFERQDFQFHGDINYDILDNLTMNVGTSNEGAAMKANGVDSNISVYDEKSTIWRFGISATL